MAHIRLKSLVEQIQVPRIKEAAIHPEKENLKAIQVTIEKYLNDREKNAKSFLSRAFAGTKRWFLDVFLDLRTVEDMLGQQKSQEYKEIISVLPLNKELKKYGVSFNPYLENSTLGAITKSGQILINPDLLKKTTRKDGRWDMHEIMTTIAHEYIHRGQYARGLHNEKPRTHSMGGADYFNDQSEVMAWGHTLIHRALAGNPDATLDDAISYIKSNRSLVDFLKRYTPENRKKIVRHMVDYATEVFTKKKKSA